MLTGSESWGLEQFRSLADTLPQLIWTTKPDGRADYCNQRWLCYTGMAADEANDWSWKNVIHPDDLSFFVASWTKSIANECDLDVELRIKRASDGVFRWHLVQGVCQRDQDGTLTRWVGTCTDIEEHRPGRHTWAKRTGTVSKIASQEEENRLRSLGDSLRLATGALRLGIWDWDIQSNCIEWDARMREIYDVPKAKQVTYQDWAAAVFPEDLPRAEATLQGLIASRSQDLMEFRIQLRSGEIRHIQAAMRTDEDDAGKVVRVVGVNQDITDRKLAEQQIRELNSTLKDRITELKRTAEALAQRSNALARSNQSLEEFAYAASHDLQEPLRGVTGCVQLLRKNYGEKLDARADEFIRHSVLNVERMQAMILALLDYTRVERLGNEFTSVDTCAALRAALANLAVSLEESGAQVTAGPLPVVRADQPQLVRLFQNLVGNSLKFRGTEKPQVRISAEPYGQGNEAWVFRVSDNGIGIEPQYFERIFGVFQRLHARDKYQGTGIGLAICRKIVERHGGRLWVESTPGQGSTFLFTLGEGNYDRSVLS